MHPSAPEVGEEGLTLFIRASATRVRYTADIETIAAIHLSVYIRRGIYAERYPAIKYRKTSDECERERERREAATLERMRRERSRARASCIFAINICVRGELVKNEIFFPLHATRNSHDEPDATCALYAAPIKLHTSFGSLCARVFQRG